MSYLPLRLPPAADLRRALESAVGEMEGAAGFVVSGIGSLQGARLRLANDASETSFPGAFEILCLSGTLTPDGAHLHMAIADTQGRVVGGHVGYGNIVRTTAEVLLVRPPGWVLGREMDARTGFNELVVRPGVAC